MPFLMPKELAREFAASLASASLVAWALRDSDQVDVSQADVDRSNTRRLLNDLDPLRSNI